MVEPALSASIELLDQFGFFQIILPLLLIFVVFYAVLIKTGVLGDADEGLTKGVCAIVSFVAAFLVISYTPVLKIIQPLIAQASLLLIIVMLVLMTITFVGFDPEETFGAPSAWLWIIVALFVIIFLGILDASGFQIPIIHQIVLSFTGTTGVVAPAMPAMTTEGWNTVLALLLAVGLPVIVIALIIYSSD